MLKAIFQKLENDIRVMNLENAKDGLPSIPNFYIKVLGQTALLEAKLGFPLFATTDVDAFANFVWIVRQRFGELLNDVGHHFDDHSNEIWMPEETQYRKIHSGKAFDGFIAEPEYVLISKAKKAPAKNQNLIRDYLASGPSELFLVLAQKYQVNLESFL